MWALMFCVILLIYFLNRSVKRPQLYPPGPPLMPVLGNLLSVVIKLRKERFHHRLWQEWTRQYGELLGLRLGAVNVVVVSGRDLIKEVSAREVFEGRPDGFFYTMRSFGKKIGLVFSDGPKWSKTRRFVLKYLKNFGYNTRHMDNNIGEECKALIEMRMSDAGSPVLVNTMFQVSIVNIMWRLVAGKSVIDNAIDLKPAGDRAIENTKSSEFFVDKNFIMKTNLINFVGFDLDDSRLQHLCHLIERLFKAVDMSGGILNFLPFLRHIAPNLIGFSELQSIHNQIHKFIKETIEEHKTNIDVEKPRDVIDAFLIEMMEQNDQSFTNEDLYVVCLDLLEAGMETVSSTAVFMLLHLVRDQEIQKKLQMEIDRVIGRTRTPTVNDRTRMVYAEAVILETLRISSVAAVGIPHMAVDDARLGDYIIPKGTFILLAMYDLHNGHHWKEADVFRPERFITKEGSLLQDAWLMPFGTGKRRCIGEGLARSELFMFLTHLLQSFTLKTPSGDPLPSTEPIDGLSLSAKPFRVVFEPRL